MHPLLLTPVLLGFALPSALSLAVPKAWTPERLLARHVEALGGPEALRAHRSRRTVSTLRGLAPFDVPVTVEQTREGLYRRDVRIQEGIQVTAFDGREGWKIDPFGGGNGQAVALGGEALEELREQADFDGDLVDTGAKGASLEYLGLEAVEGRPAHKLRLLRKSGRIAHVFLDAETFLEVRRIDMPPTGGGVQTFEIRSGDYREVGGLRLPFAVDIRPQGAPQGLRIQVERVEVNPSLDPARFRRPSIRPR